SLGIDGNEDRHDAAGARADCFERLGFHRKGRRTNIRTVGISEEHQHELSPEILVRPAHAVLVGERKWTAHVARGTILRRRFALRGRGPIAQTPHCAGSRNSQQNDTCQSDQGQAFHSMFLKMTTAVKNSAPRSHRPGAREIAPGPVAVIPRTWMSKFTCRPLAKSRVNGNTAPSFSGALRPVSMT